MGSARTLASRKTLLGAAGLAVLLALFAVFPLVITNPLATTYGFDALIFVAAASAWNIFSGYSGYLSLGHAIFFGTGMYAVAIGARDWKLTGATVFALLPLAALVAGRSRCRSAWSPCGSGGTRSSWSRSPSSSSFS